MYTLKTLPMLYDVDTLSNRELKRMLATLNATPLVPSIAKLRAQVVRVLAERNA